MKRATKLGTILVMVLSTSFVVTAFADEHRSGGHRAPPPKFQAHPAGVHPHGAIVRPHPVRVLSPRVIVHGRGEWAHWDHPEFSRPVYYWDWGAIRSVSCVAEDSYGDQYPVTETTFAGFGLENMTAVEDDALDRCYSESGGDNTNPPERSLRCTLRGRR